MRLLTAVGLAVGVAVAARAETQSSLVYDFQFEKGPVLPELRVAYETYGKLNAGRDNAILLLHGTSGDRHAFDPIVGPGKTFDTDKYFVITVDAIGGGKSSSPKDGLGQDFPRYTIRDMMAAQHALVTGELELATLRAVAGSSMGSFVGLEWGSIIPRWCAVSILLVPSPKSDSNFQLTIDLMTSVIALDPELARRPLHPQPDRGPAAAPACSPTLGSCPAPISSVCRQSSWPKRWKRPRARSPTGTPIRWSCAMPLAGAHDVSGPFGGDMTTALSQIAAPILILPSVTDRLLGLDSARRIRDGIKHAGPTVSSLSHRRLRRRPRIRRRAGLRRGRVADHLDPSVNLTPGSVSAMVTAVDAAPLSCAPSTS